MSTDKQKIQEQQLKDLATKPNLSEKARKAVNEKLKGTQKPFNK